MQGKTCLKVGLFSQSTYRGSVILLQNVLVERFYGIDFSCKKANTVANFKVYKMRPKVL